MSEPVSESLSDVETRKGQPVPERPRNRILLVLLPLLVVLLAVVAAAVLIITKPKAERGSPPSMAALVSTEVATPSDERVVVEARGSVVPSREIVLRSRVGGEIVSVSDEFVEGGFLEADREILKIDPVDSELVVARAASRVATVNYEHSLEQGRLQVAQREWELLDAAASATEAERALALREPQQLRIAADLKAAEAELRQAELNLERTSVSVPFNAMVTRRFAELGARVSIQDTLASLVGTDTFWIRVSVPVDRLAWIDIPRGPGDVGAEALVYAPGGGDEPWEGRVIRLLGDVEERGRMARLLVEVQDPMGLLDASPHRLPLLLGSYVRVELQGRMLEDVIRIPRLALRDNTHVWVALPDDTLGIRPVEVIWRDAGTVLLERGLDPGERVVVSDIPMPSPGLKLQLDEANPTAREEAGGEG